MISISDPNPVLVEIILSVSENYAKVYCVAQHTSCAVSTLPCYTKQLLELFCLLLNTIV